MKTSQTGLDFIKGFESFVPYVYDDLVPAKKGVYREWRRGDPIKGTLTIGWGHTDAARYKLPFKLKDVPDGFRITQVKADQILAVDLSECEEDVLRLVKKPLTQGMFDACVSFCYNCGPRNFANIAKRINAGNYAGARAAFDLYVKSKGVTLRGLQRRRDGEQALWDSDIPPVPTEPVDHPAEVDVPPVVDTSEIVKTSRKAKWLQNIRRIWNSITITGILGGVGIANDTAGQVKSVISLPIVVAVITTGILMVLAIKYIEALLREDVEEGRYVPSQAVEAVE